MLDISLSIFEELENANISYCHWKSNEHLKEGMIGKTDLDVLVDYRKRKECEKLLHQLKLLKVKAPLGNSYRYVDDWIGMDFQTGKLIHLHLHYRLVTGTKYRKEFVLPWSNLVLHNCIKDEKIGVYMTNPNMEIIILYTRIFLKAGYKIKKDIYYVPSEYIREIHYLKKRTDEKWINHFLSIMLKSKVEEFKGCLFQEKFSFEDFLRYRNILYTVLNGNRIESERNTFIRHQLIKKAVFVKQYFKEKGNSVITAKCPNKRGIIIVFVGPDGSGKSTISKIIQTWLNWKIEAQRFYLGSGDGLKKPLIYEIYTSKFLPEFLREYAGIIFYLYMSFYVKRTLKRAAKYVNHGGIAILDRFPQLEVEGINDGPKIETLFKDTVFPNVILKKVIVQEKKNISNAIKIKPDLLFRLKISPEEAFRRKREGNILSVKQKVTTLDLIHYEAEREVSIDATQKMNDEILEVKNIIWEKLYKDQLL